MGTSKSRKDARAVVSLVARYRSPTTFEYVEEECYDVSVGGMFIKSGAPAPAGTLIKLECEGSDHSKIRGVARVVWLRRNNDEHGPIGMGVKFVKLETGSRAVIATLVQQKGEPLEDSPEAEIRASLPPQPRYTDPPSNKVAQAAQGTAEVSVAAVASVAEIEPTKREGVHANALASAVVETKPEPASQPAAVLAEPAHASVEASVVMPAHKPLDVAPAAAATAIEAKTEPEDQYVTAMLVRSSVAPEPDLLEGDTTPPEPDRGPSWKKWAWVAFPIVFLAILFSDRFDDNAPAQTDAALQVDEKAVNDPAAAPAAAAANAEPTPQPTAAVAPLRPTLTAVAPASAPKAAPAAAPVTAVAPTAIAPTTAVAPTAAAAPAPAVAATAAHASPALPVTPAPAPAIAAPSALPVAPAPLTPSPSVTAKKSPKPSVTTKKPSAVIAARAQPETASPAMATPSPAPVALASTPAAATPIPSAEPKPTAKPKGTPMEIATACLSQGDNECVIQALQGKAKSAREYELLIETLRAVGRAQDARKQMTSYVARFPDERRAVGYRRLLATQSEAQSNPAPSRPTTAPTAEAEPPAPAP